MNRNSMEVIEQSVVPWLQSLGYRLRTVWGRTVGVILLILFLFFNSCDTMQKKQDGFINEFVLMLPDEPNCAAIGFKISSNNNTLKKAIETTSNYKIEIKGAFFNDSLFSMASPSIKLLKNDTFVITSRSCYFNNKNQNELNKIADDALNKVSITVIGEKTKWVFRK